MAESQEAFEVVIAALTAQRDRIDLTITTLRQLVASGFTNAATALTMAETLVKPIEEVRDPSDKLGPGAFLGMTIVDAAKKQMAHERRQLTNGEIVEAFKKGGLILNSADPLNTVGSVLNRRFMQVGDVVRVGRGTWGLKEWYPNRSFKAAKADDRASSQADGVTVEASATQAQARGLSALLADSASARAGLTAALEAHISKRPEQDDDDVFR